MGLTAYLRLMLDGAKLCKFNSVGTAWGMARSALVAYLVL